MGSRGPQPVEINWAEFDKLASYQCTQGEIADFFGISVSWLEDLCERHYGEKLSVIFEQKKAMGRSRLRKIQWAQAEQGSTAMAIFLGKHLLGQSDEPLDKVILEHAQKIGLSRDQLIELLNKHASETRVEPRKSFEEFCTVAGYPAPFPKQIEMMHFGMTETEPRLLLGARGYGKTDYAVILGIAYDLYCSPLTSTNLILTKSKERNSAIIAEIQAAAEKNGVQFEKANQSMLRVLGLHGKDHSVSAVTIRTTSLRGRHPKRVIMDDPVTEDDTSEATRLLVEKKWNEINKLVANVLIIGQPAHKYDLYAKLRPLLKKMEVPWGAIPELDADLEAQRAAGVDEKSIQASYHLKIINEGATPFDNIRYLDKFPIGDTSSVAFIDPSSEGGDHTAMSIIKRYMDGVAVVGFQWKKAWNHSLDDMIPHLLKYKVARLAIETNALGDMPLEILRALPPIRHIGVVGIKSSTNKHSRILAAGMYAHMIHLSKESDKTYVDHVVQYEYKSKFDDAPDSLATGLKWIGLIRGKE